jgi:hypothetical protein
VLGGSLDADRDLDQLGDQRLEFGDLAVGDGELTLGRRELALERRRRLGRPLL